MVKYISMLILALLLSACGAPSTTDVGAEVRTKTVEGFGGVIAEKYEDSQEWWAPDEVPNEDAPNVIIFLLDDVGFAQVGSFGGLMETPNIDNLADNGLRFNNFHTTALCSPSRASLMAGRFPHSIGMGSHALTAMGFPGYNAIISQATSSSRPTSTSRSARWSFRMKLGLASTK